MAVSSEKIFLLSLVRHGMTAANRDGIIQGQQDVPLSDDGRHQAMLLGQRLADEQFTHIFASDLSRAYETAELVQTACVGSSCSITTDARLRERCFGVAEGHILAEFVKEAKENHLPLHKYTPHNAELPEQLFERAVQFFTDICKLMVTYQPSGRNTIIKSNLLKGQDLSPTAHVLAVTHGGIIRMLLHHFETLGCSLLGNALRTSPNTGLSSFIVKIDASGVCISLDCLCMHCNDHLKQKQ